MDQKVFDALDIVLTTLANELSRREEDSHALNIVNAWYQKERQIRKSKEGSR
jgi:hypothetical protein